jgi:hypothetical protein
MEPKQYTLAKYEQTEEYTKKEMHKRAKKALVKAKELEQKESGYTWVKSPDGKMCVNTKFPERYEKLGYKVLKSKK